MGIRLILNLVVFVCFCMVWKIEVLLVLMMVLVL